MKADERHVMGYCPMGCGETLFRGDGGYITCRYLGCGRPDAVSSILEDRETEHLVEIGPKTFSIKHPLRERLDDDLLTCDLHSVLAAAGGPPSAPGRYRVRVMGSRWAWETLS